MLSYNYHPEITNQQLNAAWRAANYEAAPYSTDWVQQVRGVIREIVANEPRMNPYTPLEILETASYLFGLRGVSLTDVEAVSMPAPEERKRVYKNALVSAVAEKAAEALQKSGKTVEELNGLKPVNFESLSLWEDVRKVMSPIIYSGISSFERKFVERETEWRHGADKERLDLALNYCVREGFLKRTKDGFAVTEKSKSYAEFTGLKSRKQIDAQGA